MGTGVTVFYCAPGASGVTPAEDQMLRAHEVEAAKWEAVFGNYGWVIGHNSITSKTSRGILETSIDLQSLKVTHEWTDQSHEHRPKTYY
jgi:hypothetical protein